MCCLMCDDSEQMDCGMNVNSREEPHLEVQQLPQLFWLVQLITHQRQNVIVCYVLLLLCQALHTHQTYFKITQTPLMVVKLC